MDLFVFRSLWGMTGTIETYLDQIAADGYDGIDAWIDFSPPPARLRPLLGSRGLRMVAAGPANSAEDVEPILRRLIEFEPMKYSLLAGHDSMTRDEGCRFFESALKVEQRLGIEVYYETHRGRPLFTPWDTAYYLNAFPDLKITADFSHWVNVCERLPDDQAEALDLAARRTGHIHARVGYEEGPQVPDPRAPEYAYTVEWHEAQWKKIARYRREAGRTELTVTPEYGPPTYLHTLPYTRVPVADLDDICRWAARRIREILV